VKRVAFALAALAAGTVALAQQTNPPPAEPPTGTTPQEQTAPPDSSTQMSEADKQTLWKDCVQQVQAANPNVPEKDVKAYCDKQVKSSSSPQ
jgi:hypothetical protein